MTDEEPPWFFRYVDDASDDVARKLGHDPPIRPAVAIRLSAERPTTRVVALVDSGSERTLAAPGLARAIGVDLRNAPEVEIGIGGSVRKIRVAEVTLQMYADILDDDAPALDEWRADVGFFNEWSPPWAMVLGRRGFFERYTVTMHGGIPALVVDSYDTFDQQYGVRLAGWEPKQPRFRP